MSNSKRLFPCEKTVVLNALYDALDGLSFVIDKSNSVRGTLLVSSATFPEMKGRITVSPALSKQQTLVEVFPDRNDGMQSEWIDALMDEARAIINKAQTGKLS